jgi:uncharacterized membrane protein YGL010W
MPGKTIQQWFDEYGESHQNPTNKLVHWICVPSIFFSIVCLLSTIPISGRFTVASLAMIFASLFYVTISPRITIGLVLFYMLCLWGASQLALLSIPLWQTALAIFVIAWIGQFIGHKIEGKKPSFLKDIQFLLIGPAWLMGFIYQKLGIKY